MTTNDYTNRMIRRYYAVAEIPHSNLSHEDSQTVVAFKSRSDRDKWVSTHGLDAVRYLRTYGERRRAVTRGEAQAMLPCRDWIGELASWPSTHEEMLESRHPLFGGYLDADTEVQS